MNEPHFPTYAPRELPNPQAAAIDRGVATFEVPVPDREQTVARAQRQPDEWSYAFIDDLKQATEKPEGFIPTLDQANDYALSAVETAYPDRPYKPGDTLDKTLAGTHAAILRQWIQDAKNGKTTPETVSVYALMTMEKMRMSFETYLQEVIRMDFRTEYSYLDEASIEKEITPEALMGPRIEHNFLSRVMPREHLPPRFNETDITMMKLLGHYRSFVLGEEVEKAARDQRPVDKNVVRTLWEANNVRSGVIHVLQKPPMPPKPAPLATAA